VKKKEGDGGAAAAYFALTLETLGYRR